MKNGQGATLVTGDVHFSNIAGRKGSNSRRSIIAQSATTVTKAVSHPKGLASMIERRGPWAENVTNITISAFPYMTDWGARQVCMIDWEVNTEAVKQAISS